MHLLSWISEGNA